MKCPRCGVDIPDAAHFCHACGMDARNDDVSRRGSFAAKPDEPVASFALISTIMPKGTGNRPRTYRLALAITVLAALVAAMFGALPVAVLLAAFAIPIVYIVYLYDVNLWEDQPIRVTVAAFVLTAVLAAVFLVLLKSTGLLEPPLPRTPIEGGTTIGGATWTGVLVAFLLIPVVGEVIRQVGPVLLARRPEFDDLIDGLTFGIVSGVAYATADTLVRHWPSLTGGYAAAADPGTWVTLVFLEGFIKPLIIGTASGIACAEFSGLGEGYDGFTRRYGRGLLEAIVANVAYTGGIYLLGTIGNPTLRVMLQALLGLAILAVLIVRVRNVLHVGLLEAALEAAARGGVGETAGAGADGALRFCQACEMPLLPGSRFCSNCGTAAQVGTRSDASSQEAGR